MTSEQLATKLISKFIRYFWLPEKVKVCLDLRRDWLTETKCQHCLFLLCNEILWFDNSDENMFSLLFLQNLPTKLFITKFFALQVQLLLLNRVKVWDRAELQMSEWLQQKHFLRCSFSNISVKLHLCYEQIIKLYDSDWFFFFFTHHGLGVDWHLVQMQARDLVLLRAWVQM